MNRVPLNNANDVQALLARTISENAEHAHDPWYLAEEIMDAFNDAGHPLTDLVRGTPEK